MVYCKNLKSFIIFQSLPFILNCFLVSLTGTLKVRWVAKFTEPIFPLIRLCIKKY